MRTTENSDLRRMRPKTEALVGGGGARPRSSEQRHFAGAAGPRWALAVERHETPAGTDRL